MGRQGAQRTRWRVDRLGPASGSNFGGPGGGWSVRDVPHARLVASTSNASPPKRWRSAASGATGSRREDGQDAEGVALTRSRWPGEPASGGCACAYELKEYLATILEQATPDDARELLDQWLDWASRSRLAPFVKLARTIRKHAVGILAYLDTRMTNGPVEGINNKLRVIARRAYGFHSHGALISMLFLCCGGIELAPPLTRV